MSAVPHRSGPWRRPDSVWGAAWVLVAAALALLALLGSRHRDHVDGQVVFINLAALGCGALLVGHAGWLLRGRAAIAARRRVLLEHQQELYAELRASRAAAPPAFDGFVVVVDGTMAHRSGCPLTTGRQTQTAPPGLTECGVCAP